MKITYILQIVSEITGVDIAEITSKSKVENVVMAKRLFVEKAKKIGFTTIEIAEIMHVSAQAVRNLNKSKETRKLYKIYSQKIEKIIANAATQSE